mmetsp:Transcript_23023/g.22879  ORF Transcript_23023/g.22879 Transcript_23023/m.22879 type:complete len:181 (-) Transcript_23023:556-1098(-)
MENKQQYQKSQKEISDCKNQGVGLTLPQIENSDFEYAFRHFERPSMATFGFESEKDKDFPYFTNAQAFEKKFKEEEEIEYFSEPKFEFDNYPRFLEMETSSPHSKSLDIKLIFGLDKIHSEQDNSFAFRSQLDEEFMKTRNAPSIVVKQDSNEKALHASATMNPIVEGSSAKVAKRVNSS